MHGHKLESAPWSPLIQSMLRGSWLSYGAKLEQRVARMTRMTSGLQVGGALHDRWPARAAALPIASPLFPPPTAFEVLGADPGSTAFDPIA